MRYCVETEIKHDIIISGESTQFISMFSIDTYTCKYSMNINTFTHPKSVSLRLNNYSYKIYVTFLTKSLILHTLLCSSSLCNFIWFDIHVQCTYVCAKIRLLQGRSFEQFRQVSSERKLMSSCNTFQVSSE